MKKILPYLEMDLMPYLSGKNGLLTISIATIVALLFVIYKTIKSEYK